MPKIIRNLRLLMALVIILSTPLVHAQSFSIIYSFTNGTGDTPLGGPWSGLLVCSNTLYGSTTGDGAGYGTLFSIKTDGTQFTVLHTMSDPTNGEGPSAMILVGNSLFGTTSQGGPDYLGNVFSIGIGTTNYNSLFSFQGTNGGTPIGGSPAAGSGLVAAGNTLYGTTAFGGTDNEGTVFSIETNGLNFQVLHNFGLGEGTVPEAALVLCGSALYGTTRNGGSNNDGTIFSMNTNGSGFATLHNFNGEDGESPNTDLTVSGATLFGTAGTSIFSLNTNGTGYTVIHTLQAEAASGLTLRGDMLFGTTTENLFMLKTNGSDFTTLENFANGSAPEGDLTFSGSTLYGVLAEAAGGYGSIYSLTIAPIVNGVNLRGNDLVMSGTMGLACHTYIMLMSTNVALPLNQWTPVWTNTLTSGGDFVFTATNVIDPAALQEFFALKAQ